MRVATVGPWALALLLSSVAPVSAFARTLQCEACSNQEMRHEAEQYLISVLPGSPAAALHTYVVNVQDGLVRKYTKVQEVPADPEDVVEYEIVELAVEPPVTDLVSDLQGLVEDLGDELDLVAAASGPGGAPGIPSSAAAAGFPGSAYENIQRTDLELNVKRHVDNTYSAVFQRFSSFVNSFNPFAGFDPGAIVVAIQVNFPDGSYAVYNYNHATKEWDRVPGTSRDSNGNLVPETVEDVHGGGTRTYRFEADGNGRHGDLTRFIDHVTAMGFEFSGSAPSGTSIGISCSPTVCIIQILQ